MWWAGVIRGGGPGSSCVVGVHARCVAHHAYQGGPPLYTMRYRGVP
nr:MAG TPA: hypothetical protein [Caudoviricetes sp.]